MKIRRTLVHLLLLACALLHPAAITAQTAHSSSEIDQSISANIGDPAQFHSFFTALQQSVAKHDAATVASLVSYPITIDPHTKRARTIRTTKDFIARYDGIVTPHIAEIIAKQRYEDLFVNYQGAMLGSGEVWIAGICRDKACKRVDIRIRTIQNTAGK